MSNVNLETGIRYGLIAARSLDSELVCDLQTNGIDLHWEEAASELRDNIKRICKEYLRDSDSDDVADQAVERMSDNWEQDEPVHSFDVNGVKGQTTWLGGALLVMVFESPFTDYFDLCSPCVPNCCDLDSFNPDGYIGYTVPENWRNKS